MLLEFYVSGSKASDGNIAPIGRSDSQWLKAHMQTLTEVQNKGFRQFLANLTLQPCKLLPSQYEYCSCLVFCESVNESKFCVINILVNYHFVQCLVILHFTFGISPKNISPHSITAYSKEDTLNWPA